ncbi:MAG: hypothetical protein QXP56_03950 [Archaeoglobaceae archaeon]
MENKRENLKMNSISSEAKSFRFTAKYQEIPKRVRKRIIHNTGCILEATSSLDIKMIPTIITRVNKNGKK